MKKRFDGISDEDLVKPAEEGECVICDGKSYSQRRNQITGEMEFVHIPYDPGYLACWEVWRYLQEKPFKESREEIELQIGQGDYSRCLELAENQNDPDYFLDNKDFWSGYRSYMQSREWAIKADFVKRRGKCERCGAQFVDLDTHHLTYDRLFREQIDDLMALCQPCHREVHGLA